MITDRPTNAAPSQEPASPPETRSRPRIHLGLDRFSGLWALAIIILIFGLWIPGLFLQTDNLKTILIGDAITAMVAMAVLVPLVAGAYDLSVAANVTLGVILVTLFQSRYHMPWIPASLLTLACCTTVGVLNGISVVFLKVNSFIATLAMSSILAAVVLWITGGSEIVTGISNNFLSVGQENLFGFSLPVYYMIAMAIALYVVLEYTPFGRYLFAVGDNTEAARLAGIRTGRYTFLALTLAGAISGIAGVVLAMRIGSGSLDAGLPYLLPAFAAAFLGSTQLRPGRFNVGGTILAVYLLATGVKGLQLAGADVWVSQFFNGVALLIAVSAAAWGARNRRSS